MVKVHMSINHQVGKPWGVYVLVDKLAKVAPASSRVDDHTLCRPDYDVNERKLSEQVVFDDLEHAALKFFHGEHALAIGRRRAGLLLDADELLLGSGELVSSELLGPSLLQRATTTRMFQIETQSSVRISPRGFTDKHAERVLSGDAQRFCDASAALLHCARSWF